jgi:hypothetical protein
MKLNGENKTKVELRIVGYQFPNNVSDEHDANWLRVFLSVTVPEGSWETVDSCLLTWEVNSLADWLQNIAEEKDPKNDLDFIEPNLRCQILDSLPSVKRIRIFFELESRPRWKKADWSGMNDLWAELNASSAELLEAAKSLRDDINKFPQRAIK